MSGMRIGHGYDVHKLVAERKLILGGVEIPHVVGLLGHSDADVLLHAIMDAIIGAMGLGDIGKHFPDTDGAYLGISSMTLLEKVKEMNEKKANLLYDYLDSQDYYIAPVEKESRSMMNVTFVTGDADLDKKFAKEADAKGLKNLKGHRSVGGMRASIYNAMPYEGVAALVEFMKEFAKNNPKG